MKQYEINRAYGAMTRLMKVGMPVKVAYDVYMLSRTIEPAYRFELEQEKKLLEKFNGHIGMDGGIVFQTNEDAEKFQAGVGELNALDIELEYKPVIIPFDALAGSLITPSDVADLEGFISFG